MQKQEKKKLEAKFKNIFLSSMSHNLKTPINSNKIRFKSIGLIINNEILCKRIKSSVDPLSADILGKDKENLTLLDYQVCDILVSLKYDILFRIFHDSIRRTSFRT